MVQGIQERSLSVQGAALPKNPSTCRVFSQTDAWGTRWLHLSSFLSSKESGEEVREGKGRRHQTVKKSLIPPGTDLSLLLAKIQEFQPS